MAIHTHFGSVCGERNFSSISGSRDASGRYVFYIYTHTQCPLAPFAQKCALCVDLMESGFPWLCDRLLITCDQNSTQRRALLFFFLFFFFLPWAGMGDVLKLLVFACFLVSFFSFCLSVILHPYWRTSHLELPSRCAVLGGGGHGHQFSGIGIT